jgi:hypothetical protein
VARRAAPASSSEPDGGALLFEVYSRGFPLHDERLLVLQDLADPPSKERGPEATFGHLGRVFLGNRRGLRAWSPASLDADAQAQLRRIVARLRVGALSTVRYRAVDPSTRQGVQKLQSLERSRERQAALDRDAAQSLGDLADRLGPKEGEPITPYAIAAAPPPAPPPSVATAGAEERAASP